MELYKEGLHGLIEKRLIYAIFGPSTDEPATFGNVLEARFHSRRHGSKDTPFKLLESGHSSCGAGTVYSNGSCPRTWCSLDDHGSSQRAG